MVKCTEGGKFWLFSLLGTWKFRKTLPLKIYHEECIFPSLSRLTLEWECMDFILSGFGRVKLSQSTLNHLHCYSLRGCFHPGFSCYHLPSLYCCYHFLKGLRFFLSALPLMLIHKAVSATECGERAHTWLRPKGNPRLMSSKQNTLSNLWLSWRLSASLCNKQLLLAPHHVGWSWILPAGRRHARAACILPPHFCSCHAPFHALSLTSCAGPVSPHSQKALALPSAFTRAHGQQDLHGCTSGSSFPCLRQ